MAISNVQTLGRPMFGQGQKADYTTSTAISNALPDGTTAVRLESTTECFVKISLGSPTAVVNVDLHLSPFNPEWAEARPGEKVAAVQVSTGGTLYVMPY